MHSGTPGSQGTGSNRRVPFWFRTQRCGGLRGWVGEENLPLNKKEHTWSSHTNGNSDEQLHCCKEQVMERPRPREKKRSHHEGQQPDYFHGNTREDVMSSAFRMPLAGCINPSNCSVFNTIFSRKKSRLIC